MIDLHTHFLPGLDDGVESSDGALEAIQQAIAAGVTGIVLTPHQRPGLFDVSAADILHGTESLIRHLKAASVNIPLYPGAEVHIQEELIPKVKSGELMTLNQTGRYILLELPYIHIPERLEEFIFQLKSNGIHPIIAHPERNRGFRRHPHRLYELVRIGAYSQITAASLVDQHDPQMSAFCRQLIEHHLCHVIASDAHGHGIRGPQLPQAKTFLTQQFPSQLAQDLFVCNPQKIIQGEELEVEPPEELRSRSKLFGLLK